MKREFSLASEDTFVGDPLAEHQTSAGNGKEALATLDALEKLPAPASEDARIDLSESQAARSLSDSRRHLEAAARVAEKAARQGALHLVARARFEEGVAYQNLAEVEKSRARLEEAQRIFAETGDRKGVAASMCNIGLLSLNEPAKTMKTFQESLAIYRALVLLC
jgi:tetratricopeptide (TPR) repeat protein